MHDDAAHRCDDSRADFDEHELQSTDLRTRCLSSTQPPAEFLKQRVRHRGHQETELVCEESLAARAIGLQRFHLFDSVLGVAARAVDCVHVCGRVPEICQHEALIVFGCPAFVDDDFGLDDHASLVLPATRFVALFAKEGSRSFVVVAERSCHVHPRLGKCVELAVALDSHDVLDFQLGQDVEKHRMREARIEPNAYASS